MSADRKRLVEALARAEAEGLEVVSVTQSKHVKLRLRAPDGRERLFSMSVSPSCPFEDRQRSMFRRFARGLPA